MAKSCIFQGAGGVMISVRVCYSGERCVERLDAVSDMKARFCGVVDWLFSNPDYDPKPRVIQKEKYLVLVDVTF